MKGCWPFAQVLPYLLFGLSKLEGLEARSWKHRRVLQQFFIFCVFNFFLVTTIAGSLMQGTSNSPLSNPHARLSNPHAGRL